MAETVRAADAVLGRPRAQNAMHGSRRRAPASYRMPGRISQGDMSRHVREANRPQLVNAGKDGERIQGTPFAHQRKVAVAALLDAMGALFLMLRTRQLEGYADSILQSHKHHLIGRRRRRARQAHDKFIALELGLERALRDDGIGTAGARSFSARHKAMRWLFQMGVNLRQHFPIHRVRRPSREVVSNLLHERQGFCMSLVA